MAESNNPGEDKAWELLATLRPEDVCKAAMATYDFASTSYRIRSFGMEFMVSVKNRVIASASPGSDVLLGKLGYFFRLTLLWHLVTAKDITATGRLTKLELVTGGDLFTRGAHALPLDTAARKYKNDRDGFLNKGASLGGEVLQQGDASLRLYPLPRIPVVLTLWLEDDEFPARLDLLFDSTCDLQAPIDILWSVAMTSVLIL